LFNIVYIFVTLTPDPSIIDETSLSIAEEIAAAKARCDYAIMVGAAAHNAKILPEVLWTV
jgi:hypothetical protein